MSKTLKIKVDGTVEELPDASYETIRAGVGGGWIQAIQIASNYMYMDEEGKLKELPYNHLATMIARPVLFPDDDIRGDAVICGPGNADGEHLEIADRAELDHLISVIQSLY